MGGGSPLLPETQAQARALDAALKVARAGCRGPVLHRHALLEALRPGRRRPRWRPSHRTRSCCCRSYPQFSTTTTASSLKDWKAVYRGPGRSRRGLLLSDGRRPGAVARRGHPQSLDHRGRPANVRLLFSAHGLPQKIVDGGDPYRAQIEATAAAIGGTPARTPDRQVCFQSRVGRLQWLTPSTDDEIRRAGAEGKGVVFAPIAFVSEHVETLVELDHEYAELARKVGAAPYLRARTPGVRDAFIDSLAKAVTAALERPGGVAPDGPWRCPAGHAKCALKCGRGARLNWYDLLSSP